MGVDLPLRDGVVEVPPLARLLVDIRSVEGFANHFFAQYTFSNEVAFNLRNARLIVDL
ncbi:MAG: hypothetical protein VCB82_01210 [Alphaproteobacteria bacterium]